MTGRRVATAGVAVLVAGIGLASTASGATQRARLTGLVCKRAMDPPVRVVAVTAVMRPLAGTQRMALRFQLVRRGRHGRTTYVRAGDLGRWITPSAGNLGERASDEWRLIKQVIDLSAPAVYRLRVTFRWTGVRGSELAQVVRLSPKCYEPELRPDLRAQSIRAQPVAGSPNQERYVAMIHNAGATGAGPFAVKLTQGARMQRRSVAGLRAHATVEVTFLGRACSSGPVTVTADPGGQVDDYDRANNSLTGGCA